MIFESNDRTYNHKGSAVPIWKFDTDSYTVFHYDERRCIEDKTSFHSECIRYHINYLLEHNPDRLDMLVNKGEIVSYLDQLESKIITAVDSQVSIWKETDKEYLLASANDDNIRKAQLTNLFEAKAKEIIYAAMVYV